MIEGYSRSTMDAGPSDPVSVDLMTRHCFHRRRVGGEPFLACLLVACQSLPHRHGVGGGEEYE